MKFTKASYIFSALLLIALLGCGGVDNGVHSDKIAIPLQGTYIVLRSDASDFIGRGQTYIYTPADAHINIKAKGGHLSVTV